MKPRIDERGSRLFDALGALCFSLLCVAGAIRIALDVGQWIYLSIIGILLVISLPRLITRLGRRPNNILYLSALALLIAWLMLSANWTSSSSQWREDFLFLISFGLIAVSVFSLANERVVRQFLKLLIISGVPVGVFVIRESGAITGVSGYGTAVNDAYLPLGTAIGLGFIAGVMHVCFNRRNRCFWMLATLFLLVSLSLSLARGSLIFSISVLLVVWGVCILWGPGNLGARWKFAVKKYAVIVTPLLGLLVYLALGVERTAYKLGRLVSLSEEWEGGGRGYIWNAAWQSILDSPIVGYGLGSNGLLSSGNEVGGPHNFLLQVWLDGGAVALLLTATLLIWWLVVPLQTLRRRWNSQLLVIFSLVLFIILEYSKSSNFYTARSLIVTGGFVVFLSHRTLNGRRSRVVKQALTKHAERHVGRRR